VNFFQRFKITRELSRLEQRARDNPSPSTFVDIAQVYINLGMVDQTLRIADQGLALFPMSEELKKLHRFARRSVLTARIQELRKQLSKTPEAQLYRELAEIYLELSDFTAVQGTCDECLRHFPADAGTHLVLARGRLKNFYRELMARDGLAAVNLLKRAAELDPQDHLSRRLLAELLYRVGAIRSALSAVAALKTLLPEDPQVLELFELINSKPVLEEDLEAQFHGIEETGRLSHPVIPRAAVDDRPIASEASLRTIRDGLGRLVDAKGVLKAAYIRGSHALVKGAIHDGKDPFLKTVRVIARASQRTCRRMDVGSFSRGVVEGPFGRICLCCYGEVVSALLCPSESDVEALLGELQDLVADSLATTSVQEA
jgi:tetratricopeptide (TPR) repeat protein